MNWTTMSSTTFCLFNFDYFWPEWSMCPDHGCWRQNIVATINRCILFFPVGLLFAKKGCHRALLSEVFLLFRKIPSTAQSLCKMTYYITSTVVKKKNYFFLKTRTNNARSWTFPSWTLKQSRLVYNYCGFQIEKM